MPQTCSAAGCKSRKDKDCRKSFYRIPVDPKQRERWIAAINRQDWTPTQYSRICSDHFMLGQPSKDPKHPDYAPSIFPASKSNCHSLSSCKPCPAPTPIHSTEHNKRNLSDVDAAEALLHMSKRPRVVKADCKLVLEEKESTSVNGRQNSCYLAILQTENNLLREEVRRLQAQRRELEIQKRKLEVDKISLGTQNKKLEANNIMLSKGLQDSEGRVNKLKNELFLMKFGAEIVSSQL